MAQIIGFSHAAFNCADLDASAAFYCETLGLRKAFSLVISEKIREVLPDHPMVSAIGKEAIVYVEAAPGNFIELFRPVPGADLTAGGPNFDARGFAHISLQTDDLDGMLKELREKGVTIDSEKTLGPDGTWSAWIRDPDGNRIELMEYTADSLQLRPASGAKITI